MEQIDMPGADVTLYSHPDLGGDPGALFDELRATIPWSVRKVKIFNRWIDQPRATSWHGDEGASYTYSGAAHQPRPWTPALEAIRVAVERIAGTAFNSVLLNLYADERSSMGMHSDDEPELGPQPIIASVSLGAERELCFRPKRGRAGALTKITLPHGSLLVMKGDTQRNWVHGIDKVRLPCGPRINLTFRQVVTA